MPEVVGIHAVTRGQQLVHERLRVLALLVGHAAVARRRRGAHLGRAAAERLLRRRRQRAEAHARDRYRDPERERLAGEPCPEDDVRRAPLAVALERIARDRCAQEQEVVEMRHAPLRAEAADVVDPLPRGALDLCDDVTWEQVRLSEVPVVRKAGIRGSRFRPRGDP
jgi:hypothetical protein